MISPEAEAFRIPEYMPPPQFRAMLDEPLRFILLAVFDDAESSFNISRSETGLLETIYLRVYHYESSFMLDIVPTDAN